MVQSKFLKNKDSSFNNRSVHSRKSSQYGGMSNKSFRSKKEQDHDFDLQEESIKEVESNGCLMLEKFDPTGEHKRLHAAELLQDNRQSEQQLQYEIEREQENLKVSYQQKERFVTLMLYLILYRIKFRCSVSLGRSVTIGRWRRSSCRSSRVSSSLRITWTSSASVTN